jgi:hypothetical protein
MWGVESSLGLCATHARDPANPSVIGPLFPPSCLCFCTTFYVLDAVMSCMQVITCLLVLAIEQGPKEVEGLSCVDDVMAGGTHAIALVSHTTADHYDIDEGFGGVATDVRMN